MFHIGVESILWNHTVYIINIVMYRICGAIFFGVFRKSAKLKINFFKVVLSAIIFTSKYVILNLLNVTYWIFMKIFNEVIFLKSMQGKKADTKTVLLSWNSKFHAKIHRAGRVQLLISRSLLYEICCCAQLLISRSLWYEIFCCAWPVRSILVWNLLFHNKNTVFVLAFLSC